MKYMKGEKVQILGKGNLMTGKIVRCIDDNLGARYFLRILPKQIGMWAYEKDIISFSRKQCYLSELK